MTEVEIIFSYTESLKDSYDNVKKVEITTRSTESDEIIAAFIEFGRSIGLEMNAEYVPETSGTAH